jgi:hypothetical protein
VVVLVQYILRGCWEPYRRKQAVQCCWSILRVKKNIRTADERFGVAGMDAKLQLLFLGVWRQSDKIGDLADVVECGVVAARRNCEVSKVSHECVAFPAQQKFDFHLIESFRIQGGASADAKGMR